MKVENALQLADWLRTNEPEVFAQLERSAFTAEAKIGGITDFFKSVGTSISTGVSSVAKFLTSEQGIGTLTALGGAYLTTKTQQNVMQTQIALAQAGMPVAPIANQIAPNGQFVPVDQRTGQPVYDLSRYQPSLIAQYGLPIAVGAGILLLFFVMKR